MLSGILNSLIRLAGLRRLHRRVVLVLLIGAVAVGLIFWMVPRLQPEITGAVSLQQARDALARNDFPNAERIASEVSPSDPAWLESRLLAGEAAIQSQHHARAIAYLQAIPRDGSPLSRESVFLQGEVFRDTGRLMEAEAAYEWVLKLEPDDPATHERLAFLLGVTGRRHESRDHFLALIRSGRATLQMLALLGDLERPVEQAEYLQRCAGSHPEDVLVRLGLAAQALHDGRTVDARGILETVVARAPHLIGAQALLGELLLDEQDAFQRWASQLPSVADSHPEIWFIRGLQSKQAAQLQAAARCFWQTLKLAPAHRRATYQLGQVLNALEEPSATEFTQRAVLLFDLTHAIDQALQSLGRNEQAVRRVIDLLQKTGRIQEAAAWTVQAGKSFPNAYWPPQTLARLQQQTSPGSPQVLDRFNLALRHDFTRFLAPELPLSAMRPGTIQSSPSRSSARIRFESETGSGIDFVYENGADPDTPGARVFEQNGGGVAVLDLDMDDWPDLFFTQGTRWRTGSHHPDLPPADIDRLYRNRDGVVFTDITGAARLVDLSFGQGCTAADFNEDGFVDLYVAAIGRNQLFRNNGDGTFTDVSQDCGLTFEDWTASVVIADMNEDGVPDIFDVTYLTGAEVYRAICDGYACSPKVFEGTPDRLLIGRGDGRFEDAGEALPDLTGSKGLGVVAATPDGRGRLCLFVANDQVPNFLLRNRADSNPFNIRLQDEGFLSGVAFNTDGLAMASMGVAADDANGDGRLDLLVTTFKDEPFMLFQQDASGLFADVTGSSGLKTAGLPFVGWGTQFLDADLDGHPDLVVVNGHVDDYRRKGGEYHMPPQFFHNTGRGKFIEAGNDSTGAFFSEKRLGRGLARIDWNRDGRMDFVVSNIGHPASLVTNRTTSHGRFLNVTLHATKTARDAIGSVVIVSRHDQVWSKQLVAGDGYMASNQRMLSFGTGPVERVDVRVQWPSGRITQLRDVATDAGLILVEDAMTGTVRYGEQWSVLPVEVSSGSE